MKMSFLRVSLKNLYIKKIRSLSIILATALATGLVFTATTIIESVESSMELGIARLGADIVVVPKKYYDEGQKLLMSSTPQIFYMNQANIALVSAVDGVNKVSPQLFTASTILDCCSMPTVMLVGYDPATDFTILPWQRYEHKSGGEETLDELILGASALYASEGAHIKFFGKRFKITSSNHPTGVAYLDFSIFMTMDAARDMIRISQQNDGESLDVKPDQISSILVKNEGESLDVKPDQISSILVKIAPGYDVYQVAKNIEDSLDNLKVIVTNDLITTVKQEIKGSLWGVIGAGLISWLMTLFLMGTIFTMMANERQREFGLLRAMGATKFHVLRLIITEAYIISFLGALVGITGGWVILTYSQEAILRSLDQTTFLWPSPLFIGIVAGISIIAIVVSCILSVVYPAIKAGSKDPYLAIRQGR